MKIAPLFHALKKQQWCSARIVHTGQHYDSNMSDSFFSDLNMPAPHYRLGIGSGSHAEQTAAVMVAYERVCLEERPDWVVVVGDVNSTAACAMVGAKLQIPVVHLEAGLRSGDRRMPEEINRLVTDAISDVLWIPSADAGENLRREGVSEDRIDFVGNIMIDSYEMMRAQIVNDTTREQLGLKGMDYAVATLHRPSNVDDRDVLDLLIDQLLAVSRLLKIVFSIHPRTKRRLEEFRLLAKLRDSDSVILTEPLSYIQFMNLVSGCKAVITDSGGVQEETTYLSIPCFTLRENTERPITISEGTNRLVPPTSLLDEVMRTLHSPPTPKPAPAKWDGQTAGRCVEALAKRAGVHDRA